jgi:cobalt/nickel transport system ATP-binding protein
LTILRAKGLHYTFPGAIPALAGLDLTVAKGRSLAILGPNGAGKSTLFLHLNGTLRPDLGEILLQDSLVRYDRKALAAWRARVALVLQDPDDQLFAATVAEDVSFGPLNLGLSAAETKARVHEALEALGIADLADRATHMLSGGQKKRAAIAGAVAMHPEILLLDEPTAGLDLEAAEALIALLRRLSARGMTLVFSTHDIDLAWALADDVALFQGGRVVGQGGATEILADARALAEVGLRPPVLVDLWQAARAQGLTTAPCPRDIAGFRALMAGWVQATR